MVVWYWVVATIADCGSAVDDPNCAAATSRMCDTRAAFVVDQCPILCGKCPNITCGTQANGTARLTAGVCTNCTNGTTPVLFNPTNTTEECLPTSVCNEPGDELLFDGECRNVGYSCSAACSSPMFPATHSHSNDRACWCDSACVRLGDCCHDFETVACDEAFSNTSYTCEVFETASYNSSLDYATHATVCGGMAESDAGFACSCDAKCAEIGDCCHDFNAHGIGMCTASSCAACAAYESDTMDVGCWDAITSCTETECMAQDPGILSSYAHDGYNVSRNGKGEESGAKAETESVGYECWSRVGWSNASCADCVALDSFAAVFCLQALVQAQTPCADCSGFANPILFYKCLKLHELLFENTAPEVGETVPAFVESNGSTTALSTMNPGTSNSTPIPYSTTSTTVADPFALMWDHIKDQANALRNASDDCTATSNTTSTSANLTLLSASIEDSIPLDEDLGLTWIGAANHTCFVFGRGTTDNSTQYLYTMPCTNNKVVIEATSSMSCSIYKDDQASACTMTNANTTCTCTCSAQGRHRRETPQGHVEVKGSPHGGGKDIKVTITSIARKNCDALEWTPKNNNLVCAQSKLKLRDGSITEACYENDYAHAACICSATGARLCTKDEFDSDYVYGSGCSMDSKFAWSSSNCTTTNNDDGYYVIRDKEDDGEECRDAAEEVAVRCCSDTNVDDTTTINVCAAIFTTTADPNAVTTTATTTTATTTTATAAPAATTTTTTTTAPATTTTTTTTTATTFTTTTTATTFTTTTKSSTTLTTETVSSTTTTTAINIATALFSRTVPQITKVITDHITKFGALNKKLGLVNVVFTEAATAGFKCDQLLEQNGDNLHDYIAKIITATLAENTVATHKLLHSTPSCQRASTGHVFGVEAVIIVADASSVELLRDAHLRAVQARNSTTIQLPTARHRRAATGIPITVTHINTSPTTINEVSTSNGRPLNSHATTAAQGTALAKPATKKWSKSTKRAVGYSIGLVLLAFIGIVVVVKQKKNGYNQLARHIF